MSEVTPSSSPELFRHDGLGRKLGPFPIWGWAVIIVAVIFIGYRLINGGSLFGSSTAATQVAATGTGTDAGTVLTPGSPVTSSDTTISTNAQWLNSALNEIGDTVQNQQALQQYLNGGNISQSNADNIINKALGALGAPPQGTATPVNIIPTPTPSTTPKTTSKNGNPFGASIVYALKSAGGAQFIINSQGKAVTLTSQEVSQARKSGYNYQPVVVSSTKAAGAKS